MLHWLLCCFEHMSAVARALLAASYWPTFVAAWVTEFAIAVYDYTVSGVTRTTAALQAPELSIFNMLMPSM